MLVHSEVTRSFEPNPQAQVARTTVNDPRFGPNRESAAILSEELNVALKPVYSQFRRNSALSIKIEKAALESASSTVLAVTSLDLEPLQSRRRFCMRSDVCAAAALCS